MEIEGMSYISFVRYIGRKNGRKEKWMDLPLFLTGLIGILVTGYDKQSNLERNSGVRTYAGILLRGIISKEIM